MGRQKGIDEAKLAAIATFEHSPLFTDAERAALRLAEAMCERTVEVSDEVFEAVRKHFSDREIVELSAQIALENMRARFNRVFQVGSDNLCMLPERHPERSSAAEN